MARTPVATSGVPTRRDDDDLRWRRHVALGKALRLTLVLPSLFALIGFVLDRRAMATFAAFATFALLGFADFGGPLRRRAGAYVVATAVGAVLVVLGTAVSGSWVAAALAMVVVGFAIQVIGVFGGYFTASGVALTLAFVLSATVSERAAPLGDRLAGWAVAGAVATVAAVTLWPTHERRSIATAIGTALHALADLLDAIGRGIETAAPVDQVVADRAAAAVADARHRFRTTPIRPAGPSRHDRAVVYAVDQITWVHELADGLDVAAVPAGQAALAAASADALRRCGDDFVAARPEPVVTAGPLDAARRDDLRDLHRRVVAALREPDASTRAATTAEAVVASSAIRVISHATLAVIASTRATLGHDQAALPLRHRSPVTRAAVVLAWHLRPDAVVFRNAVRMAVALGLAVAVALRGDVSHAFWVALGAMTALRSNVAGTGWTVVHALVGTLAGFAISGLLITVTGLDGLLWVLLPIGVFLAAYAPTAIGFTVGQASFTIFVVVLFNLLDPTGWAPARARLTDIAIGCAVSMVASVVLWPRGASGALAAEGAAAVAAAGASFLARARRLLAGGPAADDSVAAATAAGRRADEALGVYLDERGTHRLDPEAAWTLVTTGLAVRLTADGIDQLVPLDPGTPADARAGRALLDDAAATVDRLVARAEPGARRDDRPSARGPLVVAALAELDPRDDRTVDTAVTLGRFAAWLDRLDRLADRLPAR